MSQAAISAASTERRRPRGRRGSGKGNQITFTYKPALDAVLAEVSWSIAAPDDVRAWAAEYENYFRTTFPDRKVDVILELSEFHISPKVTNEFGEQRAKLLRELNGLTYRVRLTKTARVAMYTSHVLLGATCNSFESIDDAVAALVGDRQKLARAV